MTPISGTAALIARVARLIKIVRVEDGPSRSGRAATSLHIRKGRDRRDAELVCTLGFLDRQIDSRAGKTPGMAAIGSRRSLPSMMKIGQIKSSTDNLLSCTSRRDQSALRMRRSRRPAGDLVDAARGSAGLALA